MKIFIKACLVFTLLFLAKPAHAHDALYYSFATNKIYFYSAFPYAYWWGYDWLEPRPYQRRMPQPSYAAWKRNQEQLTKLALAKMQAYSELMQQSQPVILQPEISLQPVPKTSTVPQILWQPQTDKR